MLFAWGYDVADSRGHTDVADSRGYIDVADSRGYTYTTFLRDAFTH